MTQWHSEPAMPRNDWRRAPRATPTPSPLQRLIGRAVSQRSDLSESDKVKLRVHALRMVPALGCKELDDFFINMIADEDVLWALFRPQPKRVTIMGQPELINFLPFDKALKAGQRARTSELLLPHERPAAWVAGFAWSIGTYAAACPCLNLPQRPAGLRALLLEEPLGKLKRCNPALGSTLAAALGCGDGEDCDPAQVGRIGAAGRLANLEARPD